LISKHYSENLDFTIHFDACTSEWCKQCRISGCQYRKMEFEGIDRWEVDKITKKSPHRKIGEGEGQ